MKISKIVFAISLACGLLTACQEDEEIVPKKPTTAPTPAPVPSESSSEGIIAIYEVSGDEIRLTKAYKADAAYVIFQSKEKHQEVWDYFTKLIPANARPQLKRLVLVADDEADYAAYVAPINEENLSSWEMGLNFSALYINGFMDKPETGYTMIHEFGHLLTLHAGQIDSKASESTCSTFFTGEGCSKSSSYLKSFFNNFWKDIYAELVEDEEDDNSSLYNKYSSRFVTSYAASNPGEDIAESFTHFVLKLDKASGSTIADKKVNSFYDYQEAASIRDQIRKNLDFEYGLSNARSLQRRSKKICRRH